MKLVLRRRGEQSRYRYKRLQSAVWLSSFIGIFMPCCYTKPIETPFISSLTMFPNILRKLGNFLPRKFRLDDTFVPFRWNKRPPQFSCNSLAGGGRRHSEPRHRHHHLPAGQLVRPRIHAEHSGERRVQYLLSGSSRSGYLLSITSTLFLDAVSSLVLKSVSNSLAG